MAPPIGDDWLTSRHLPATGMASGRRWLFAQDCVALRGYQSVAYTPSGLPGQWPVKAKPFSTWVMATVSPSL